MGLPTNLPFIYRTRRTCINYLFTILIMSDSNGDVTDVGFGDNLLVALLLSAIG
jgi:hypothetical protein